MTKIKMCGLRRAEDIEFANMVKPDYIGYVFAEKSKRYITPEKAAELTKLLDGDIVPVGVVKMVQLHGSESEDFVSKLKNRGIPVIKAFQVGSAEDIAAAERSCADMVLLDSGKGSGQTFDWSLIGGIKRSYLLAGGMTAENAAAAIGMLRPYGVDASSCLETDGFKDIAKMKAFAQAVRAAE